MTAQGLNGSLDSARSLQGNQVSYYWAVFHFRLFCRHQQSASRLWYRSAHHFFRQENRIEVVKIVHSWRNLLLSICSCLSSWQVNVLEDKLAVILVGLRHMSYKLLLGFLVLMWWLRIEGEQSDITFVCKSCLTPVKKFSKSKRGEPPKHRLKFRDIQLFLIWQHCSFWFTSFFMRWWNLLIIKGTHFFPFRPVLATYKTY